MTWEDSRDFGASCFTIPNCPEIYYKRSTDGGASWGSDVRITYDGAGGSFRPSIAAPGLSTVIIGFQSNRDGGTRSEQQVVRSIDNGGTWGSIQRMTSTAGDSEHDNLVASGSTAHLSWSEDSVDRTSHTVHYRGTWDEGAMWAPDETVSQPIGGTWSIIADLGVSTSFVHALWTDDLNMLRYARRPSGDAGAAGAGGAGGAPSNGGGGSATGGAGGVGGAGGANAQGGSSTGGGGTGTGGANAQGGITSTVGSAATGGALAQGGTATGGANGAAASTNDKAGCGCRVVSQRRGAVWWVWLALGVAMARRRRGR